MHECLQTVVLLNRTSGHGERAEALEGALRDAGVVARVRQATGLELRDAARQAVAGGARVVVAAGGDGTINAIAGALVGTDAALGVLPVGTLNHFARDVGLPLDLAGAARVIAAGNVRRVDVGEVNGYFFLNNSSIGLYPHIVHHRDDQRQRLGRGKWLAMALAGVAVFRRYPLVSVELATNGQTFPRTTPFVFIGNNRYEINLLALGGRRRLDGGELCVYFANRTGRFGLVRLMFRALLQRLNQARDFDAITTTNLVIGAAKPLLRVAVDGEVLHLKPPLRYRSVPLGLRVLAPVQDP